MTLRKAIDEAIDQVVLLIELSEAVYNQTASLAPSPIGKHVRHIIDHFLAFQSGLATGCVNYNLRHRNSELERNPALALQALDAFTLWLNKASLDSAPIEVISEISVSQQESIRIQSSVHRELVYLINHALHHTAYANLLAKALGIAIPEYIGVAPATASHQRIEERLCAR